MAKGRGAGEERSRLEARVQRAVQRRAKGVFRRPSKKRLYQALIDSAKPGVITKALYAHTNRGLPPGEIKELALMFIDDAVNAGDVRNFNGEYYTEEGHKVEIGMSGPRVTTRFVRVERGSAIEWDLG